MESEWERKANYVALDLEGAKTLLNRQRVEILAIELITEGKANTNYLLETAEGRQVLRIHQRQSEADDFASLAPSEIPVPQILAVGPGFTLLEWKPGTSLEQAILKGRILPYEKIARQLAQVRRALDDAPCDAAGFFGKDIDPLDLSGQHNNPYRVVEKWPSAIEGLLGYLRYLLPETKLPNELKTQIARVVDDAEPKLQAIAGPPVLVHGDFKPSNLLVDESGLTAVLDWEFIHAGTWLSDVGQLLRHPESLPNGFVDAFLDELKAPPDTMLLSRVLDFVNLIDFLHKEEGQPKMRTDVTRRIAQVCDEYESRP